MFRIGKPERIASSVIIGFDVETNPDGSFNFGYAVSSDEKFKQRFNNKKEAIEFLDSKKYKKTYIVGMNLAYDFNTLFPQFNPKRIINKGKFITLDFEIDTKKQSRNTKIVVVDVGNYIQQRSLKQIANEFGFEYIDVHDVNDSRIDRACYTHALSSAQIMQHIQNIASLYNCNLKLTAPSMALAIFRKNFLKPEHEIYDSNHTKEQILEMKQTSLKTYHGAATEVFKKGTRNVTMVDVVSMYPAMMKKPLPDMNHWKKVKDIEFFHKQNLINNLEGMALVELDIPETVIPPFLYQEFHGKNLSKTGTFLGWLNFVDIRYAQSQGATIEYFDIYCFRRLEGFFNNYVDTFFKLKKQPATKQFAKLMLNSLYGKFGQKPKDETMYKELKRGKIIDLETEFGEYDKIYSYEEHNFLYERVKEDKFPSHSYPLIASYITSYARQYLHETMQKIGFDKIVYCDTDSIAFEGNISEIETGHALGEWEEKWTGKIECIRPKMYRYLEKNSDKWEYVIKGIPKRKMEDFWNNGFVVELSRPRKYFSAIRRGEKINEWVTNTYKINPCMQKRIFHKNGDSRPYNDNDVPFIS